MHAPIAPTRARSWFCVCVAILTSCGARSAAAQSFTGFSYFSGLGIDQMDSVQVKLSYVGPVKKTPPTVAFTTTGHPLDLPLFTPFNRPGFGYGGDPDAQEEFTVTRAELKAVLDSAALLPDVVDGDVDPGGTLSFAILSTTGGATRAFEAIVNGSTGTPLFVKMLGALASNRLATRSVYLAGCVAGMLPYTPLTDITANASIQLKGLRLDRTTGQFVGTLRVTNVSATMFEAPLYVSIEMSRDVQLVNPDGYTCMSSPSSLPLLNLLMTGSLSPGSHLDRVLRFDNPERDEVAVHDVFLYAGPGTP